MNRDLKKLLYAIIVFSCCAGQGRTEMPPDQQPIAAEAPAATPANTNPPTESGVGMSAQGGGSRSLGVSSWISRGRTRLSVGAGWGSASNGNYALLSAGVGYFLLNGFEAGLDGEAWLGNQPQIYKVTPGLRYVFHISERLFPYVGGFYRRIFYSDESPLNSVGARLGAYVPMGGRAYLGGGVVFERELDCETSKYKTCQTTYPEFTLAFTF